MLWTPIKKSLCVTVTITHLMTTTAAVAQPVTVNSGRSPNTLIDSASNGVPIIHTADPNAAGVSHNVFETFNVDQQGIILNNANDQGQSQLGGFILANPNLVGGAEANLIINEVTGGDRSNLLGLTEVFGGSADYILANPFGITCDGCGFINTPRVTLSTGAPIFGADGSLSGLNVTGGDILITGAGLNASNVDFFDIVTRSAKINADLIARDLGIYAGVNTFDYASRTVSANGADGAAPSFAIDSSALGGMYANRIRLIGTEAGVGVNLQGLTASLAGDLEITADGRIDIASASATGDVAIASGGSTVAISERLYAGGDAALSAADAITLSNGFAGAAGDLEARAGSVVLSDAMLLAGLSEDGTLSAEGGLTLEADQAVGLSAATLAATGEVTLAAGALTVDGASQISGGDVALTADAALENSGVVSAEGDLSLSAGEIVNRDGATFSAVGDVTADAADTLSNRGLIQAGGALSLSSEGDVLSDGRLATSGDAAVQAEALIAIGVGATAPVLADISTGGTTPPSGADDPVSGPVSDPVR